MLDVQNGFAFDSDLFSENDGMPLIRIRDLKEGIFTDTKYKGKFDEGFRVRKGDYLIGMDGEFRCYKWKGEDGLLNQRVCRLIKFDSDVFPEYIFYGINLHLAKIERNTAFVTVKHISSKQIKEIKFPFPPLEDQIRIANILSKAEALISQRKESLRLLDELLKSTFLEMFGDPVRNEKGWEKLTLKEFGKIITGNTPPRNDDDNYSSNFIEWIKTDNIESDKLFVTKATEYLSESGAAKARFVDKGALLIACIAGSIESVGRAALTNRRVSFNQQINAIQPSEDISSYFLLWLFKISKLYIQNHATKGMKKILTKGDFEKIIMINPPLKLQTQFAHIVEKTEALKAYYQTSLQELENLYGSLSQKAFSSAGASAQAGKGELGLKGGGASYAEALEWFSPTKQFITKLESFKSLEPNWDSYGAQPPSSKTVETAINFVKKADKNELPLYFVAPGPNGELVIEFRKGKKEASAFINPDGSTELILNEGNNYVLEGTLEDNYKDLLNFINA